MVLNFFYSTLQSFGWEHVAPLWVLCPLCFEPGVQWVGLPVPVFSFWEKWVWARKHHRFTHGGLSHGCGFVFLLFQVLALFPNPLALHFCAWLPGRWTGKQPHYKPVLLALKIYLSIRAYACLFFLTKNYFACRRSVDHLSPAAVPSLHLPLFLPGEGHFVRRHCTKHPPAVSCTWSQLEEITLKADRGEEL